MARLTARNRKYLPHNLSLHGNKQMTKDELKKLEKTLWQTADMLRANSDLKPSEYSTPVLGLIFLKFADNKYSRYENEIKAEFEKLKGTRREKPISEIAIEKCGFYLPTEARYEYLLNLPEKQNIAKAIKDAMALIEQYKPELAGTLPGNEYTRLVRKAEYRTIPKQLLKNFADIPKDATGDIFGQIYEYFLGNFALAEGQQGGTFFTPNSVVRLMVEIIEPHNGTVFDPACGSGGMFVHSAQFIEKRKSQKEDSNLFVYGQEKTEETVKLARMNIAVNGLRGEIKQANTYYEDPFSSFEKFDYVLANPPFNVDDVLLAKVEGDKRFNTHGVPRNKSSNKTKDKGGTKVPNANYLWINLFATSLKKNKGRAALVMANSASDAMHSEAEIRKTLIEKNLIYSMLSLPSNMFYTVTLPAMLWFFDKGKKDNKILFIDARSVFTQIDRAHREFSEEQIQNLAMISRLHRDNRTAFTELVHHYLTEGFSRLSNNRQNISDIGQRMAAYLPPLSGKDSLTFSNIIANTAGLYSKLNSYTAKHGQLKTDELNKKQRELNEAVLPLFATLHNLLKETSKRVRHLEKQDNNIKELKEDFETLLSKIKDSEYYFTHTAWLQARFPKAEYEDVTGLCKLATIEEIKEQEYSLNPGRYVGVVIEEDGKTEEEFIEEMLTTSDELFRLNSNARKLEAAITHNIKQITGEE